MRVRGIIVWALVLGCNSGAPMPVSEAAAPAVTPTLDNPAVAPDLEPRPEPTLRVATYNILAAKLGTEQVIETLQEIDADILALQEVDRNTRRFGRVDLPVLFGERLGLEVAFVPHREFDGGEIGVALLSKYPIKEVKRIETEGSILGVLDAIVTTPSGDVRVFVVHFHPTDPRDDPAQRAHMEALRLREATRVASLATAAPAPRMVLGDFNAMSGGPEYQLFWEFMQDACPAAATWPTSLPLVRIDYLWIPKDYEVIDCPRVHSEASDHVPVVANLRSPKG